MNRHTIGRANLRSESNSMEAFSVGLRRSEIDGYVFIHHIKVAISVPEMKPDGTSTNTNRSDRKYRHSIGRNNLRSESNGMEAFSVGLRRSEIDGYVFIRDKSSHLCPRDEARL